jgi:hypothetical protein
MAARYMIIDVDAPEVVLAPDPRGEVMWASDVEAEAREAAERADAARRGLTASWEGEWE